MTIGWHHVVMWLAVAVAFGALLRQSPSRASAALREGGQGFLRILPLITCGLLAAGFLAELVPDHLATTRLGPSSGIEGHLVATAIGAILPGGPFVSFPVALAFVKAGAGAAQMVTMIAAWSVLGVHRILVWEWPTLGGRFVMLRLASGVFLPPLAGVLAEAMIALLGFDPVVAMIRPR